MRSGESSIEQRPDTRICVVQRISDGMKECEGDMCQRKSKAVEKECRASGGQTDMMDHHCLQNLWLDRVGCCVGLDWIYKRGKHKLMSVWCFSDCNVFAVVAIL